MRLALLRIGSQLYAAVRRLPNWIRVPLLAPLALIAILLLAILFFVGFVLAIPVMIVRGLWFRFFPPKASRDISRLDGENLDAVRETIEDEGQPLKEHHRRRIFRDPRLLPKPKPPDNVWPRPRRESVMTADEADRLFAGTLRTRNRRIRDLLADEEQLSRLGLPVWKTEADLAEALGLSIKALRHYAIHRPADRTRHYVTFTIPKRNGRPRVIMAPKRRLKKIQRTLLKHVVEKLPVSEHAHGFLPDRSIRTGAAPHVGRAVVLKLDLKDFFPSVTFARVRGLLIACGYGYPVATTMAVLMTEAERQPVQLDDITVFAPVGPRYCVQGAPTSPGLCNAVCLRLDRRLAGLARKYGWSYTRYADDLTFSGDTPEHLTKILALARQTCTEEGFALCPAKTRTLRRGRRQTVTGVVVNDVPGLSRQERRTLRAIIHRHQTARPDRTPTLSEIQLRGKLAYLNMLNPAQAAALQARWTRTT